MPVSDPDLRDLIRETDDIESLRTCLLEIAEWMYVDSDNDVGYFLCDPDVAITAVVEECKELEAQLLASR